MKKMHAHMQRLYDAARTAGKLSGDADQAGMARLLNVAQQNVNNWEARGLSKEGALEAQRKLGVSATWLLFGEGPSLVGSTWPFESISSNRIEMLSQDQVRELEAAMRTELRHIEGRSNAVKSDRVA